MVRAVLFDLDRTLLDFDRAQRGALGRALRGLGLPFSPRVLAAYRAINDALWAAYRRGEIAQAALEVERFRRLLLTLGCARGGAPAGSPVTSCPACRSAATASRAAAPPSSPCDERFRLGVVTNGIDRVQHARLAASGLRPFFETVVTSEGCGYAKPDPRIVHAALRALGVAAARGRLRGRRPRGGRRGGARRGHGLRVGGPRRPPAPGATGGRARRVTHLGQLRDRFAL